MTSTAPASSTPQDRRIVVGFDGSSSSKDALRWAVRQASISGSSLEVIGAWTYPAYSGAVSWPSDFDPEESARQDIDSALAEAMEAGSPIEVQTLVLQGDPAAVLLDASKDAELLVVGSRGHGNLAGMLLGSVSRHCVTHAKCPVVVVHEPRGAHPESRGAASGKSSVGSGVS